jgi:hypothetical protein
VERDTNRLATDDVDFDHYLKDLKDAKDAQDALQYLLESYGDTESGLDLDTADRCIRTVQEFLVSYHKRYGSPVR